MDRPITQLLAAWSAGDGDALVALMPFVVDELERIARIRLGKERPGHTLEPMALVNEAFIKLAGSAPSTLENRAHFFAAAAETMRRILVDHARRGRAIKRGGGLLHVTFDDLSAVGDDTNQTIDLIALNNALHRLETLAPRQGRLVELRFFAGLSIDEAAGILDVSPRTARREWTFAKAWLYRDLTTGTPASTS